MATLLLRLCGPMQSWGTRSRFTERDTELEPSKSGVIGLVCAALGRPRDADVSDLAALRMGVRIDHEGTMERDYHTAGGGPGGGIVRASGALSKEAVLSNRYYLVDADFLVGLESADRGFLETIEAALQEPRWQLFLGRKSFVPSVPVHLPGGGLRDLPLEDALTNERWPQWGRPWPAPHEPTRRLRLVVEAEAGVETDRTEVRHDQPVGAAFASRTFGPRPIRHSYVEKENHDVPVPIRP
jgi:CRISPR system Cascade subunit CasD